MLMRFMRRRLVARRSLGHLDAGHRLDHEVEERPGDRQDEGGADRLQDRLDLDQPKRGREHGERQEGLKAEHRPVARAPHAPRHGAEEDGDDPDGKGTRVRAADGVVAGRREHRRDPEDARDQRRDDRADDHDARPFARLERFELLTCDEIPLLVATRDLIAPLDRPCLAFLTLGPLPLAVGHQRRAEALVSAPRRAAAASSGTSASRMALTTTTLSAPAAITCDTFWTSIPPIANQGTGAWSAGNSTRPRPVAGRPSLVGVAHTGPTLTWSGRSAPAAPFAASSCASECVDRPTRWSGPAWARASATGTSSWPTWTPSAPHASTRSGRSFKMNSAPCSRAVRRKGSESDTSSSAQRGPFSRSWTMSVPPRRAACRSAVGSRPFGRPSQTKYRRASRRRRRRSSREGGMYVSLAATHVARGRSGSVSVARVPWVHNGSHVRAERAAIRPPTV